MRGTELYQSVAGKVQTLVLSTPSTSTTSGSASSTTSDSNSATRHGLHAPPPPPPRPSLRLRGAEYVVYSELAWAGRAVMVGTSAVE